MLGFAGFCQILPDFAGMLVQLLSCSGNPKLCQLFRDFSVATFSSAFSAGRPRAAGLGWADFLPFPSCSASSMASCGVSNLPRNIFAFANHLFSGIYPNM